MTSELPVLPGRRGFAMPFLGQNRETPSVSTFRFGRNGSGFEFRSNQAIRLGLRVTDPWGPFRLFSLSSSPTEQEWIAITCTMTGSPYKEALRALTPGEPVQVIGPLGDLIYDPSRPTVMIAGGIGVTPFRGMIRFAVDTGARSAIRLLYSARVPEEFAFRAELEELKGRHPDLDVAYTVTRPSESTLGWDGPTGRIGESRIREVAQTLDRPNFLVVGLPEMVREFVPLLVDRMGIPEERVNWEPFMGY